MRRRHDNEERGAVSVEFGLLLPLFLILVLGAVHFGRVITIRHRVTDGVNYAVRVAAIQQSPNANTVRTLVESRVGDTDCASISVASNIVTQGGLSRLQIDVTCALAPPVGQSLLGSIGPNSLTVSAAMPY